MKIDDSTIAAHLKDTEEVLLAAQRSILQLETERDAATTEVDRLRDELDRVRFALHEFSGAVPEQADYLLGVLYANQFDLVPAGSAAARLSLCPTPSPTPPNRSTAPWTAPSATAAPWSRRSVRASHTPSEETTK